MSDNQCCPAALLSSARPIGHSWWDSCSQQKAHPSLGGVLALERGDQDLWSVKALWGTGAAWLHGVPGLPVWQDEMFIKLSPCFVFCDLCSERLVINSLLKRNPDLFLQVVTPRGGIKRFCRRPACMLPLAVSKIARKITQSLRGFGQSQPQSDVRVHGAVLRWGSGFCCRTSVHRHRLWYGFQG